MSERTKTSESILRRCGHGPRRNSLAFSAGPTPTIRTAPWAGDSWRPPGCAAGRRWLCAGATSTWTPVRRSVGVVKSKGPGELGRGPDEDRPIPDGRPGRRHGSRPGSQGAGGGAAAGDPAARPPAHSRHPAAGRRRAGQGRLRAPRPRQRHHHAHRLPARAPRHGPRGRRALRRVARRLTREARSTTGVSQGGLRGPDMEPSRAPDLQEPRGDGVSEGGHATYAHGSVARAERWVIASAVHVSSVRDAHDAHQNPVVVDRVDDAVLTPTRLPVARSRQAKGLAYPGTDPRRAGRTGSRLRRRPRPRESPVRSRAWREGKEQPRTGSGSCATVGQCRAHLLLVFTARSRLAASRGSTSFAAIVAPSVRTRAAIPVARTRIPGVRAVRSTADSDSASRCSPANH